jgi:hypothetical protein
MVKAEPFTNALTINKNPLNLVILNHNQGTYILTLLLAVGAFKFHPHPGRPFKEYKGKR